MPSSPGRAPLPWAALVLAACSPGPQTGPEPGPQTEPARSDVLATWEGGAIRIGDFDEYVLSLPADRRWPARGEDPLAWRRAALDEVFLQRLLPTLPSAEALEEDGQFLATWEHQRRSVLAQAYFARHAGDLEVSEADARAYFARFGHELDSPEARVVYNLLVAFPPAADEPARTAACARAEALRQEIAGGASFDAMARQHSDSSSSTNGGLIGKVTADQLRGEARDVVFSLEAGRVSRVVRSTAGCQLFLVRQISPAYEARFEGSLPEIVTRLRAGKSTARYIELYREELARIALEAPSWNEEVGPEAFAVDRVYFELEGARVTGLDVLRRARTGVAPPQALQQLASELVLASAFEREAPEECERQADAARTQLAIQYLQGRMAEHQVESLTEVELRPYFERNASRFVSEPSVELTVVSWPIGAGDPLRSMTRPRAFTAAVRRAGGRPSEVWDDFARDEGIERRGVPVTPLRTLAETEPRIVGQLLGELEDGLVVGPFAAERRLVVLVVDSYLPSRPLGFVEAIDRVRLAYARENAVRLARERLDELKREHGFRLFENNLEALGARLLDQILRPEAAAAGAD